MSEKPNCPKCGEALPFTLVAKLAPESRFAFRLTPKENGILMAETFGHMLIHLSKLMDAGARQVGGHSVTFLERVETTEDGAMVAHLVVASADGRKPRKKTKP